MFTVNRGAPRRGVILLIVLSLLAMFGLVAIGFLVITSHNSRAAKTLQKVDQQANSPEEDLHRAAMQLICGPETADSALFGHDLLQDEYGLDSVVGDVVVCNPVGGITDDWRGSRPSFIAGGQIAEFTVRDDVNVDPPTLSGRVITFLTGSCAGVTSRIVGVRQAVNPSTGPMTWSPGRPVWKLQVATEGVFPMGPDQQPGIATTK